MDRQIRTSYELIQELTFPNLFHSDSVNNWKVTQFPFPYLQMKTKIYSLKVHCSLHLYNVYFKIMCELT